MSDIHWPRHLSLYINHNEHKTYYESVEKYISLRFSDDVDAETLKRMIEADSVWQFQWFPDTPGGSYTIFGATFEEVYKKMQEIDKEINNV